MTRRPAAPLRFLLMAAVAALPAEAAMAQTAGPARPAQRTAPAARPAAPAAARVQPLVVYVVDTEGGKAALWVTPAGQSVLVDSGSPGGRDADRIMAAVGDAGLSRIDYLVSTHYHLDHIGGLQEIAKRIPVGTFVDHGPSVEEREQVAGFQQAYAALYGAARHLVVKPGDRLPLTGLDWRIVTAGGNVLKAPLPGGGGANAACAGFAPKEITNDPENAQSVGSVVTFGRFRTMDLGDLLWNKEFELMCPANPVGRVDVYFVSHHGLDQSGSAALVHGVQPRVAVMQNGTRKGAGAQAMPTMRTSPGLEDIWQLHWGYGAGIEQNSAGVFIANVDDAATIAGVLTAPPRGGGPGARGAAAPAGAASAGPGGSAAGPAASAGGSTSAPVAGASPSAAAAGASQSAPAAGASQSAPAAGASQSAAAAGGSPAQMPAGNGPAQGPGTGGQGRGGAAAAHSPAYWVKIVADADGTFSVTNSRNGFSKTYTPRGPSAAATRQPRGGIR